MSPWKLGDEDEPTVLVKVYMPASLLEWLKTRARGKRGVARAIREIVERTKKRSERP